MPAEESSYIVKRGRGCKAESFQDIRESFQMLEPGKFDQSRPN